MGDNDFWIKNLENGVFRSKKFESIFLIEKYNNRNIDGASVNSDLKLIQFSTKQRFKTDTPPLRSHTAYALGAVSRLLFTIPAAR